MPPAPSPIGGTLGILIPPSIILVVYAITTEQNIAKLFMAALIPGLMAVLVLRARHCLGRAPPARARAGRVGPGWGERGRAMLLSVWPVLLVALTVVIGGIYGGVFTPTEGAAFGTVAMLVVGLLQRTLDWGGIIEACSQTAQTAGMIFIILLGVGGVRRVPRALASCRPLAADWSRELGLAALRHHGRR